MNLQIDFMFDTERRSGSSVSQKFVIRLLAVILPVVLLGLFITLVVAYQASKRDWKLIEQEKARIDPDYQKVKQLEVEVKKYQDISSAIKGWGDSRLDACSLLRGLQRAVPISIQLTYFDFNERIELIGSQFGRNAGIYIKGKVGGQRQDADVRRLDQALENTAPFFDLMQQVDVKRFAASQDAGEPGIRVFEIECKFKPRLLIESVVTGPAK